jgi:hypothetical protein
MEGKSNETDTPRVANTISSQMLTGISADGSWKSNTAGANQNQSDSTLRRKKNLNGLIGIVELYIPQRSGEAGRRNGPVFSHER